MHCEAGVEQNRAVALLEKVAITDRITFCIGWVSTGPPSQCKRVLQGVQAPVYDGKDCAFERCFLRRHRLQFTIYNCTHDGLF